MKNQNILLLEKLFLNEKSNNSDKDFINYINKSFFMHYELMKVLLEKEKNKSDLLYEELEKNEIENNKNKKIIEKLEEVFFFFIRHFIKKNYLEMYKRTGKF